MRDLFYGKAYYNRPKCLPRRILTVAETVEPGTCHGKIRSFNKIWCVYYVYPEYDNNTVTSFSGDYMLDTSYGSCAKCDANGLHRMQVLSVREELYRCIFCGNIE